MKLRRDEVLKEFDFRQVQIIWCERFSGLEWLVRTRGRERFEVVPVRWSGSPGLGVRKLGIRARKRKKSKGLSRFIRLGELLFEEGEEL